MTALGGSASRSSDSTPMPNVEAGRHRHPLVGQGDPGQGPSAVDLADHAVVGDEDLVEEHLVEHGRTGQLAEGPDVEPVECMSTMK